MPVSKDIVRVRDAGLRCCRTAGQVALRSAAGTAWPLTFTRPLLLFPLGEHGTLAMSCSV